MRGHRSTTLLYRHSFRAMAKTGQGQYLKCFWSASFGLIQSARSSGDRVSVQEAEEEEADGSEEAAV
eukprot:Skav232255  [mRNA]  locus=scaffold273:153732:153932:- [translate_table: standard]